ncbi:transketolase, partial [Vibrio parahaemolyticus 3256]
ALSKSQTSRKVLTS